MLIDKGKISVSEETREYFGDPLLERLNDMSERDRLVMVGMHDLRDENGDLRGNGTVGGALRSFMSEHGVNFHGEDVDRIVASLENPDNASALLYKEDPFARGFGVVALYDFDATKEDMFSTMAGPYVEASDLSSIPGTDKDWHTAIVIHEIKHTVPDQMNMQSHGNAENYVGINTDLEAMSDAGVVEEWPQLYADGLVSNADVPDALLAARAISTISYHNESGSNHNYHITNIQNDADGAGLDVSADDAQQGVGNATRMIHERVERLLEQTVPQERAEYTARAAVDLDQTDIEAIALRTMILEGEFTAHRHYHDGMLAALDARDEIVIESMKSTQSDGGFDTEAFEARKIEAIEALSGIEHNVTEAKDLIYHEAEALYLSGAFEDDAVAKTAVYEFLVAARDYAPDAFGADADDTFPPPDQAIAVPDAEAAPQAESQPSAVPKRGF